MAQWGKFLSFAIAGLTLLAASPPASATEFPRAFHGLWLTGKSCDEVTGFALFANDFGLSGTLNRGKNGKYGIFGFGTDIITEAKPDRLAVTFPFGDADQESGGALIREIKDGRLFSYLPTKPGKRTEGFRCATPGSHDVPARTVLRLLRRLDVLVRAYSDIAEQCTAAATDLKPCAARIVALLDINGDGKIAPAEVTAFLRRYMPAVTLFGDKEAKFRAGYRTIFVDPDDLAAIEATTAIFGPFLTNIVFSNFDYDGKGFLTADEIALTLKQEGLPGGAGDAIRMLNDTRGQAEEALGALGGMTDMLGSKLPQGHHGETP